MSFVLFCLSLSQPGLLDLCCNSCLLDTWQKKKPDRRTGGCGFSRSGRTREICFFRQEVAVSLKFNNGSYCYSLLTAGQTFLVWQRPACIWALVRGKNNSCRTACENSYTFSPDFQTLYFCVIRLQFWYDFFFQIILQSSSSNPNCPCQLTTFITSWILPRHLAMSGANTLFLLMSAFF